MMWGILAVAVPVLLFAGWHGVNAMRLEGLKRELGMPVDFNRLVLGWKPNQYLLAPPGTTAQATPHAEAPTFPIPAERLRDLLLAAATAEPRAQVLYRSNDGLRFTVMQQTALMRFPDFVSVEVRPVPGGSTVLAYSRSVYGIRDFGVNQKRVEGWLAEVKAQAGL
ncbi:DUF1499 domain-containing protein [Aerophototrophica crusticola]|uniref:DUF1499 domain-containing protein n=1 Tax=Aerophototrophica crusticola TaxID=1709002 RepID=A0A858R5R7_9PROT|nr:DUF1499 domain-containing protein [Rhodospirillaceae bacterium B3]